MNNSDQKYYISGKSFNQESLVHFCVEKLSQKILSDFEKELFAFIIDWFSSSEFIIAKTSGSTGSPKQIQIPKKYMIASAKATNSIFKLIKKDKVLLCLPMSFIAGKMMVVRALVGSLDLFYTEPSSSPAISDEDFKFAAMVPLQASNLLMGDIDALDNIEKLIIGGSFITGSLLEKIQKINTQVWHTYGMTETITHIAVRKVNGDCFSDSYQTIAGVSIRTDKKGCLVINANHIGVKDLATNDLAVIGDNGEFQILGRVDDVINSGGLKLNPINIENKLSGIISNEYFVGSLDDTVLGQKLVLFIEKGESIERQIFDIWTKIEKKFESLEIPKEIIFLPFFIKTESGKIDRKRIVKEYINATF